MGGQRGRTPRAHLDDEGHELLVDNADRPVRLVLSLLAHEQVGVEDRHPAGLPRPAVAVEGRQDPARVDHVELTDVREAEPPERDVGEERDGALLDQVERQQVDEDEAQVLGAVHRCRAGPVDDGDLRLAGDHADDALAQVPEVHLDATAGEEAQVALVGRDDDRADRIVRAADGERERVLARRQVDRPLGRGRRRERVERPVVDRRRRVDRVGLRRKRRALVAERGHRVLAVVGKVEAAVLGRVVELDVDDVVRVHVGRVDRADHVERCARASCEGGGVSKQGVCDRWAPGETTH